MEVTEIMMLILVLVPLIGVLMAITPFLMRKDECFAVTVPEIALQDPYLKGLKRSYALIIALITAVFTVVGIVFSLSNNGFGILVVVVVGSLALCIFSYALMLYYRQKVRLYKKEKGWTSSGQITAAVTGAEKLRHALPLKWNLLYLPILLVTLAVGYAGYSQMPDVIVTHIGFSGEASGWTEKSPFVIWMPVLIQAFLALSLTFSHWTITRSKRYTSPTSPASSAYAYGMFARAQSIFLLATGLIICTAIIAMPLSFMGTITLMQAALVVLVGALVVTIGSFAISVVYGQGGSRLFMRMEESDSLLADDDQFWKLGVFYSNPADPSLFLLERFGIGWTVNWARPMVWIMIIAGVVITLGFVAAILVMA